MRSGGRRGSRGWVGSPHPPTRPPRRGQARRRGGRGRGRAGGARPLGAHCGRGTARPHVASARPPVHLAPPAAAAAHSHHPWRRRRPTAARSRDGAPRPPPVAAAAQQHRPAPTTLTTHPPLPGLLPRAALLLFVPSLGPHTTPLFSSPLQLGGRGDGRHGEPCACRSTRVAVRPRAVGSRRARRAPYRQPGGRPTNTGERGGRPHEKRAGRAGGREGGHARAGHAPCPGRGGVPLWAAGGRVYPGAAHASPPYLAAARHTPPGTAGSHRHPSQGPLLAAAARASPPAARSAPPLTPTPHLGGLCLQPQPRPPTATASATPPPHIPSRSL